MNLFVGIGKIIDVYENGRVLKFTLAIQQEKPCNVPCLIFDPNDEIKDFIKKIQGKSKVWLQGKLSSFEFGNRGKTINQIEVITYQKAIKPI